MPDRQISAGRGADQVCDWSPVRKRMRYNGVDDGGRAPKGCPQRAAQAMMVSFGITVPKAVRSLYRQPGPLLVGCRLTSLVLEPDESHSGTLLYLQVQIEYNLSTQYLLYSLPPGFPVIL